MANSYRQDTRVGELKTPLGKDTLVLVRFDGVEGVSEPFEYRIEALSSRENIDFDGAIGKHCTLVMNTIDNRKRYFDGILTEVQWMGIRDGGFGIMLARGLVDDFKYNAQGNEVTLVKRFNASAGSPHSTGMRKGVPAT